jgi:hypothetical protein
VPDRNGKIFYTSITSLSHISKQAGEKAVPKEAVKQLNAMLQKIAK